MITVYHFDKKLFYIYTIGCQMNVYDSLRIAKILDTHGYKKAYDIDEASIIIINTCTVRAKADQKVFSFLGRLDAIKKKKPDLIVGVAGCLAQQEGRDIFKKAPITDFVIGTRAISKLSDIINTLIESTAEKRHKIAEISMNSPKDGNSQKDLFYPAPQIDTKKINAFVTVMQGCDNFCSYCAVPNVRGRETSRDAQDIIEEVRSLAKSGIKEVMLLGQNVNSYGKKDGRIPFSKLLEMTSEVEDILRIRFTTSHPKDLSDDLIQAFYKIKKLCSHIHLPVQSGSDNILKLMNRRYKSLDYIEKIGRLRQAKPDIAISSDFIVGFPGETEKDFNYTLELIKQVEYDSIFAFEYSDRKGTKAKHLPDKVSASEKRDRLKELLSIQKNITIKKNSGLIGKTVEVLVEGPSKKNSKKDSKKNSQKEKDDQKSSANTIEWTGRTTGNKIVNFKAEESYDLYGKIVQVLIEQGLPNCLTGMPSNMVF